MSSVTKSFGPAKRPVGEAGETFVRINPLRQIIGEAPPAPGVAGSPPPPERGQARMTGSGRLEAAFDPARFDAWDRKHGSPTEKTERRETWVFVAELGFQYDSNLYLNPTEDDPAVGETTNVDDGSVIVRAGAEYRLSVGQGLESGIHLQLRSQRYFEESQADTAAVAAGLWLHDRWSWGGLVLPYTYTYWWDESGFSARASVHSLRPTVYWQAFEKYRLETTGVYEHRNYFGQTHDAHRAGLQLGHIYELPRPGSYVRLDQRLSKDFAGDEGYLLAEFTLGGGVPLWKGLRLDGGLTYAHLWYNDRLASEIGQAGTGDFARQDNQFRANARLFYRFTPMWEVGLDYVLTLNGSNVEGKGGYDPYDFHKHVFTILASGRF